MKKVKRIIIVVLIILVLAVVGYSCHTCSRTADIYDKEPVNEEVEMGGNEIEENSSD